MEKINQAKLKVMEALQEEAYKGIVRIDSQTMRSIDIRPGDIVEIKGNRSTLGIADRAFPSDVGQSVIRMDGILRRNAKTGIGENVIIKKADIKEAKAVTIAPAQEGIMIQADPSVFKRGLLGRPVIKGDIISLGGTSRRRRAFSGSPFEDIFDVFEQGFVGNFGMGGLKFIVASASPNQAVIITENTEIKVSPKAMDVSEEKILDVTYEDIGGLEDEIKKVREMIELPLKHPVIFERLGIQPPAGVLLQGPPGTGKTLLAKAVANECEANFILINGPEITSKWYGQTEENLRKIFEDAGKNAPSIIFIDEIDAIAPKREESYGEVERRMVATLLAEMDGLKSRGKVVVIGATNRINAIDPALRRPGRFDREIAISVPNKKGRLNILKIHTRNMPLTKDVDLNKLAEITHGFVGADLQALCKEAAMSVLRTILPQVQLKDDQEVPNEVLMQLKITHTDFMNALRLVRPSAMREVLVETPNTKWSDIGGLEEIKQTLKEAIELPLKNPEAFKRLGIRPPRGILIYGPPGTGKTLLAKAVANESEANFISIKGPQLLDKFVGESEKGVRKVFEKARQVAPAIVFFDEIDALAPRRGLEFGTNVTERVVNTLLAEMDGLEELQGVVIIAATNRPDLVDPSLLRPGRFDKLISTALPDKNTRLNIFKIHTKDMPLTAEVDLKKLAEITEFYVGADIEALCREAALVALRKDINAKEVTMKHFDEALRKVKSSITQKDLQKYKEVSENLRSVKAGVPIQPQSYMG